MKWISVHLTFNPFISVYYIVLIINEVYSWLYGYQQLGRNQEWKSSKSDYVIFDWVNCITKSKASQNPRCSYLCLVGKMNIILNYMYFKSYNQNKHKLIYNLFVSYILYAQNYIMSSLLINIFFPQNRFTWNLPLSARITADTWARSHCTRNWVKQFDRVTYINICFSNMQH